MTGIKAVKDPEPDPKQGKPRAMSGVRFPYNDLAQSVEVARTIHQQAGGPCELAQLATMLNYSGVSNGAFRTRVSAAKMFGLIEDADEGRVRVSVRGLAIVAPVSEPNAIRARVEAFMAVDLFKKVYDRFNGATLPEVAGLRNLLGTEYQVVPDRIAPTVRIMLDSADQAGLFRIAGNRSRMVMPLVGGLAVEPPPPSPKQEPETTARTGGGGGGGGDDGSGVDPSIMGLLRRLPIPGTVLSAKKRQKVIDAFTSLVAVLYPEADDEE
jgi:hypothetical protein